MMGLRKDKLLRNRLIMGGSSAQFSSLRSPFFWSLMVILLSLESLAETSLKADIYPCEEPCSSLMFWEGKPIKICCTVDNSVCTTDTSNSNLNDAGNTTAYTHNITLLPLDMSSPDKGYEMERVDSCTAALTIEDPEAGWQQLDCMWDGSVIRTATSYFVEAPQELNFTSVTCTIEKEITVWFDRGIPDPLYKDTYIVSMIEPSTSGERIVDMCVWKSHEESGTALCEDGERYCVCKYKEEEAQYTNIQNANVTLILTVSRSGLDMLTIKELNLVDVFFPEAMTHQSVDPVSTYEAQVQFCLTDTTKRVVGYMERNGSPFIGKVVLTTTQGISETLTLEVRMISDYPCVWFNLTSLTAFTNYTLTTHGIAGGGQGPEKENKFTTTKTAPLAPPVVEDFAFSYGTWTGSGDDQQPVLAVLWQALPHASRGGESVTYDLEVWSQNSLKLAQSNIKTTYAIISELSSSDALSVNIWARNEIGISEKSSTVEIPPMDSGSQLRYQVELSERTAHVYTAPLASDDSASHVLLHICKEYVRIGDMDFCANYPDTRNFSTDVTTDTEFRAEEVDVQFLILDTVLEYSSVFGTRNISISYLQSHWDEVVCENETETVEAEVETEIVTEVIAPLVIYTDEAEGSGSGSEVVNFDDTEIEEEGEEAGDSTGEPKTAGISKREAVASTYVQHFAHARELPISRQSRFPVSGKNLLSTSQNSGRLQQFGRFEISEKTAALRHSRDPDNHDFDIFSPVNVFGWQKRSILRHLLSVSDSETDPSQSDYASSFQVESDDFYKLFLSLETGGQWGGMIAPECYFYRDSDPSEVRIVLSTVFPESGQSESVSKEDGSISVGIVQACDSSPRQFLADSFQVYVSDNALCEVNISFVIDRVNPVFESVVQEVPPGWPFACVWAVRNSSASTTEDTAGPFAISVNQAEIVGASSSPTVLISVIVGCAIFGSLCIVAACRRYREKRKKSMVAIAHLKEIVQDSHRKVESYDSKDPHSTSRGSSLCDNQAKSLENGQTNHLTDSGINLIFHSSSDVDEYSLQVFNGEDNRKKKFPRKLSRSNKTFFRQISNNSTDSGTNPDSSKEGSSGTTMDGRAVAEEEEDIENAEIEIIGQEVGSGNSCLSSPEEDASGSGQNFVGMLSSSTGGEGSSSGPTQAQLLHGSDCILNFNPEIRGDGESDEDCDSDEISSSLDSIERENHSGSHSVGNE